MRLEMDVRGTIDDRTLNDLVNKTNDGSVLIFYVIFLVLFLL